MKVLLNIIKYITVMLLACCIIGLVAINIISTTILKKQFVLGKLEDTNYYEEIKKEIESNFENYIGQSGLDENVIKNIISVEQIKQDTNIIIDNIYDGENITINTETIETSLKNNINTSLNNQKLNVTQQNAINQFVEKIVEQYKETLSHTNYEETIHNVITKVENIIEKVKGILIIAVIVCVILIFIYNCKTLLEAIANIGISLVTTGVFYIIVKIYLTSNIKVSNLLVLNNSISNSIKSILNYMLDNMLTYGSILLAIGIVAILIGNIKTQTKKARREK